MNRFEWGNESETQPLILIKSFIAATALILFTFASISILRSKSIHQGVINTPKPNEYLEAQIFQPTQRAHLFEDKKGPTAPTKRETVISKTQTSKSQSNSSKNILSEENDTRTGPPPEPDNHGPIPIFQPKPVLPSYLEYQDKALSVSIDFYISADGSSIPKLIGSSGNEEIDAIALETAKKWRFRPAAFNKKPIDSRVRIRVEIVPS